METKKIIGTFILCLLTSLVLQAGKLKKIQKLIEKDKLDKAEMFIVKSLEQDSLNPGANYFYSIVYVDTSFSRYNIDSARIRINLALVQYEETPVSELKELRKIDITKLDFVRQKEYVTKLAFQNALQLMELSVVKKFIDDFPQAENIDRAFKVRDSLAYEETLKIDTWQAYKDYLDTYPESVYFQSANERYQVLIFKDYTKDDRLENYVSFLEKFPETPYRKTAEKIILERSTVDHHWDSYQQFLNKYPNTHLRKRIADILYYLLKENNAHSLEEVLSLHSNPDSLLRIHKLEQEVLFPIYENGYFSFLTLEGEQLLEARFSDIEDIYLCGNITSEWLAVTGTGTTLAIARNGMDIHYNVGDLIPVGQSAVLSKENGTLYHKSGFMLAEPVSEARALSNGWIAYSHNEKWGIVTPMGYNILEPTADAIGPAGDFIFLEKDGMYAFTNAEKIMSGEKEFRFFLDDYEVINDTLIQGFRGEQECLLNKKLEELLPLDNHQIFVTDLFWYKKDDQGYQIFDKKDAELIDQRFEYLEINKGWLALQKPDQWLLISRKEGMVQPVGYLDSVKLINPSTAFIKRGDSLQLIFQNGNREWVEEEQTIRTFSGSNEHFVLLQRDGAQKLLDSEGKTLFKTRYESVTQLTDTLFKFKKYDQFGVITQYGKELIPAKYKVISENEGMIEMFDVEKIGAYDIENKTLIPAQYDAKIQKLGQNYLVQKDGKLGLINANNKWIFSPGYDQFIDWNDSSVWAQKNDKWHLLGLEGEVFLDQVLEVSIWLKNKEETFALILEKDGYGLVSNKNGEILPAEYNEIINVGTELQPVLFAEQHLKAAKFYVVTYFKLNGEVIKSQAFRPQDYQLIYCEEW